MNVKTVVTHPKNSEKMRFVIHLRQNTFYVCKKYLFIVNPRHCWV